jgi:hypothetical protein
MRFAVVALLAVANIANARADDRVGIVVQAAPGLRGRLEEHLAAQLRREGFTAVDAPMSRDALSTLANCFIIEDLACARGVVEARSKTTRLLYVRVDKADHATTIDLTWFSAGNAPVAHKASCEDCRDVYDDAFAAKADPALRHLAKSALAPTAAEPTYEEPPAPPSRILPLSMIAGGAVTAVAGGITLYYGLRDGPSYKYVYPDLTPVGISLLAVGAGAAIAGYILLPSGSEGSHPVAAVSAGGAYLGWGGAF